MRVRRSKYSLLLLLIGGSDCCKPCVRRNVSNDGHNDDEANEDGAEV